MRTESNMTKARRIVEENEVKLGACMLKPERERLIQNAANLLKPGVLEAAKRFAERFPISRSSPLQDRETRFKDAFGISERKWGE